MSVNVRICFGTFVLAMTCFLQRQSSAQLIIDYHPGATFSSSDYIACKVKLGAIQPGTTFLPNTATCKVISPLKGDPGNEIEIGFMNYGNGVVDTRKLVIGGTYLITVRRGESGQYLVNRVMPALPTVVEHSLGTDPRDRLMAELLAMSKSTDKTLLLAAVKQMGILRDQRGREVVNEAALSKEPEMARAGVIAQCRFGIASDAKRVAELLDKEVIEVWRIESGIPQKDADGKSIFHRQGLVQIWQRGLPDFDYAAFLREGVKHEWLRKDDKLLFEFFITPWNVQRKECVPDLIKLLDDPNQNVRREAAMCLTHTLKNRDSYDDRQRWEQIEEQELAKWRKWWAEKGEEYMAEKPEVVKR